MRAAVLEAFRTPLVLRDLPDPDCPEDGVVLRVLACGVCRSDWHGWTGEHRLALRVEDARLEHHRDGRAHQLMSVGLGRWVTLEGRTPRRRATS